MLWFDSIPSSVFFISSLESWARGVQWEEQETTLPLKHTQIEGDAQEVPQQFEEAVFSNLQLLMC